MVSSLDSLPEDLRVEISSRVGASSLSAIRNLRQVSRSFRRTCDNNKVIQRLSIHDLPDWYPNPQRSERLKKFFKRCRRSRNPEALYRKGESNFFQDNRRERGLELLAEAAEKGNKRAIYLYGMILICFGDESKQKGFKILSALIQPSMSNTMNELVELRKIGGGLWWSARPVMNELRQTYVPEKCECDGRTMIFLLKVWFRDGEDTDMNTSSSCEFCLWHREFELLFTK